MIFFFLTEGWNRLFADSFALKPSPKGVHFVCYSSMVNTDLFLVLFNNFQAIKAFACGGKTMDKLQLDKNVVVWIENTGKLRKRTKKSLSTTGHFTSMSFCVLLHLSSQIPVSRFIRSSFSWSFFSALSTSRELGALPLWKTRKIEKAFKPTRH